jgi:hypothetical protein
MLANHLREIQVALLVHSVYSAGRYALESCMLVLYGQAERVTAATAATALATTAAAAAAAADLQLAVRTV